MLILGVFETVQFFAALPPIHCLEKTKYERSLFYKHPLGQSNVQIIPKQPQNNLKKIKTFFTINIMKVTLSEGKILLTNLILNRRYL